jgi:hypothetical protein
MTPRGAERPVRQGHRIPGARTGGLSPRATSHTMWTSDPNAGSWLHCWAIRNNVTMWNTEEEESHRQST